MLFNSFHYILFFLLVLLVVDAVRRRRFQHVFLLLASYYFYCVSSTWYVLLLLYSSFLDFYCGRAIGNSTHLRTRRIFLAVSIAGNLGVLAYFKYTNFALASVEALFGSLGFGVRLPGWEIFLPIGISFYTFQSMSYTLDIYFGKLKPVDSIRQFALYVSFFPQLVAGPIVRARHFLPQLARMPMVDWDRIRFGSTLILYGLIKKVCVADNLSGFVETVFHGDPTHDSLWVFLGIVAFAIQIYCDFSGYTDIAIGSARVMGFRFPDNFDFPYFSHNITEFWKRWHISLSSWLRDYLYIPLGGNRKGRPRQLVNLMVTMLLGGLWHGAAWHFVLWGLYQGILLILHKLLIWRRPASGSGIWNPLKILGTFYLTCIGWLIFILPDLGTLSFYVRKMIFWDFNIAGLPALIDSHPLPLFLIAVFALIHLLSYRMGRLSRRLASSRTLSWSWIMLGGLLVLYLFAGGQASFIYFQF
ncbi:MAG: MBOAT family protein [Candidatus Aminicenantes bacterium]|nr:MBOAT family protein [Candidatus Aminicenantes bacterium]